MKYYISPKRYEFSEENEIEFSKFQFCNNVINHLFEVIHLEEKFDLFMESYFDFEIELLTIGCRAMIFNLDLDYSSSYNRNLLNKFLSSMLSASSLYLDQCDRHLTRIFGRNSSDLIKLKKEKENLRNQDTEFGFFLELRNHSQHHDIPIVGIKYFSGWTSIGEDGKMKNVIIPYLEISNLERDTKFDKQLIEKIKTKNRNEDLLDIRPIIRNFVESLGKFHISIRNEINKYLSLWDQTLIDLLKMVKREDSNLEDVFAFLISVNDDGKIINSRKIFPGLIDRRKIFEGKCIYFINLHKKFVSNEIDP